MSLLEDRLMRIMELRQQGFNDTDIAQRMRLKPLLIREYESTVKEVIERVLSAGYGDKVRVARRIGISPLVLELCLRHYFPRTPGKITEYVSERIEPKAVTAQEGVQGGRSGNQVIEGVREPAEGKPFIDAVADAFIALGIPPPTLDAAEKAVAAVEPKKEPEQEPPLKTASNDNIVMLITRLRQQRVNTSSIAEQLHLPLRTVGRLEKQMFHLVRLINSSTQEEAEELESLRQELRISPFVVEWYLQQYRPEAPTRLYRQRSLRRISAQQEKVWSESSMMQYERYREKNRERLEKLRLLAEEGKSLAEIRKEVGWSELTVRRKIIEGGLYHPWKKKQVDPRQEQRELNQQRSQFCAFLREPLSDYAAAREGWPVQKALEYERSRKLKGKHSIPLESLICLFTNYEAASRQGERLSYQQLAKKSGLRSSATVAIILPSVNVKPMSWNGEDKKLPSPSSQKEILSEEQLAKEKTRLEKLEIIYRLAEEGRSLGEMKGVVHWARQTIRQKIIRAGYYETWKRKQAELRREQDEQGELAQQRAKLCAFLLGPLSDRAAVRAGWPSQKAVEYSRSRKSAGQDSLPLEALIRLFTHYETARQQGKRQSYAQLARLSGLRSPGTIGKILRSADVKSLYWNFKKQGRAVSPAMKKKIRRASKWELSAADISYFADVPLSIVNKYRARGQRGTPIIRFRDGLWMGKALTYRLCSQIYEAEDLGFNRKETAELYDTTREVVAYAHQYKAKLRKVMIDILESFHPEERITRPYPVAKAGKVLKG